MAEEEQARSSVRGAPDTGADVRDLAALLAPLEQRGQAPVDRDASPSVSRRSRLDTLPSGTLVELSALPPSPSTVQGVTVHVGIFTGQLPAQVTRGQGDDLGRFATYGHDDCRATLVAVVNT